MVVLTAPPPDLRGARAVRTARHIAWLGVVLTTAFGLVMLWQLLFAPHFDAWPGPDPAPPRPAPLSVPSGAGVLVPTAPLGPDR